MAYRKTYSRRRNRSYTSRFRKKKTYGRPRVYGRSKPTRFKGLPSKRRYKSVLRTVRMLKPLAEKKLRGNSIQSGLGLYNVAKASVIAVNYGKNAVQNLQITEQLPPQQLWNFDQGDGTNERVGRSLFMRTTNLTHRFAYVPQLRGVLTDPANQAFNGVPMVTRFLIIQPKTVLNGSLQLWDIKKDLFRDHRGNEKGVDSVATEMQLLNWLPNKIKYNFLLDKKFTLGPPATNYEAVVDSGPPVPPATASTPVFATTQTSKYPSFKEFRSKIVINRRVQFNTQGAAAGAMNINQDYIGLAITIPLGVTWLPTPPYNIISYSMLGTTSALDI